MDQISYQNGFICGMATKGLVCSGQLYQPNIYNDDGKYTYFYIDFRRAMQAFSIGMLTESIIVYGSVQIPISRFEKINETTYKIYANIASLSHGITVLNKNASKLHFANGETVTAFSIHMFVAGQVAYMEGGYLYKKQPFRAWKASRITESLLDLTLCEIISNSQIELVYVSSAWKANAVDTCLIVLT